MKLTDEQIIAAAGDPYTTVLPDPEEINQRYRSNSCLIADNLEVGTQLYASDAILSAAKPLRERIAQLEANASTRKAYYEQAFDDGAKRIAELKAEVDRLKAERDQAWSINPTTSEQLLRQQNAELTKQRDGFLSALESIKNASQASCSFHDIRVFASEAIAKFK